MPLSPDDILVSFDVTSLFTRVPTGEAVDAVCSKLELDDTLIDRCELSIDSIKLLMNECLSCRYFQCKGEFYTQLEGAPMGLSLSVVLANAFMESLEERLLQSAPLKPKYWRRYVDDTFIVWEHGRHTLDQFHQHLNDACPSIQFTREVEEDGKLAFLDVEVSKSSDKLKTKVYRKPTSSNVYLKYTSHHSDSIKSGVFKCLAKRGDTVCSQVQDKAEEMAYLKQIFRENGYPSGYIERAMRQRAESQQTRAPDVSQSDGNQPGPANSQPPEQSGVTYISIPYVKGTSERVARVLAPHGIKIGHNSKPTLRDRLVKVKDPIPKEQQKGVIYKTSCECGAAYVGETGRPKNTRLKEHIAALKYHRTEISPLAEHWVQCGQPFNPGQAATLAVEPTWSRRVIREALEIRLHNPSLNQGVGKYSLSPIWDIALKKVVFSR